MEVELFRKKPELKLGTKRPDFVPSFSSGFGRLFDPTGLTLP
jgi:hypothetical protein